MFALAMPRKLVAVADALLGMVNIDLLLLFLFGKTSFYPRTTARVSASTTFQAPVILMFSMVLEDVMAELISE
jgi:hypothetical protein